ncbi:MAG: cytochrome c-type biogenesis protein [Hyphomonadaceae bacterium]|nr:cytochrome c-type biogenesis protein [Hyphomonadaceae bacterium]
MSRVRAMAAALAVLGAASAHAVDPEDRLPDPAQEARAREISKDLRCLVCAGQTVDESNAPVARALRKMVRDRIAAGDDDEEVLDAVAERYGDYALLKPRFNAENLVLWVGPFLVLALGAWGAVRFVRANAALPAEPAPLTDEERQRLKDIADA